jgi:hypothetical protein
VRLRGVDSVKPPDEDFALLAQAPNISVAALWASMLEAAGFVAHVPGTHLIDEWATWQHISGGLATVFVPRTRLDEARAIIAKHPLDTAEDDEPGTKP